MVSNRLVIPFVASVGACPSASIVNFSPLLSMAIFSGFPKTVNMSRFAPAWKFQLVVPFVKPGSAGQVVFVGSQEVDVWAATKAGNKAMSAEVANNIL